MLWSLIKIILFVVAVAALALGAGYLLESEGGVQITVMGSEYTFSPLQSVIAVVVLVVAVWLLLKLISLLMATWHFLAGDETALSRYFDRNRERKGFEALSEGLMALASGEGRVAMARAAKAEKYLNKPGLTNLLTAQAAEMAGDRRKAEETYKKLVADDATRFVGVRGIMRQKLADGDTETALQLAERAFAIKPKHEEVQDVLLRLQAKKEDWSGARQTLSAKLKHGSLPRDVHKRRDAVLALSEAKDIIADGTSIQVQEKAIEANKLSPDLIPAAVMAAQSYVTKGKPRYATRILKKAWETAPHPDLAAAFAAIEPNETPAQRIKRFAALTRVNTDNPETQMLSAELHIANEDFPEARRALGNLVDTDPTARSVTLMAAIERGEGAEDAVVRGWLARALAVPRGPQWICDNCQHIHAEWAPICENCDSFDTLAWTNPPNSEVAMPGGVQMLPLIVGALESKDAPDAPDEPEEGDGIEDAEILPPDATPQGEDATVKQA
ncbi:Lipopolysaccharide assembly protein B [Roseobacter fucihabitans]|uniref:Lipopolysaccharide assembly protein B n=1 Tax=Roseobacter fucihabitans TaxID=1537242 RepID=A0ABZ2C1E3_9RHOB|nr:heme biosynthesis HemY N-terminal domain-containing protein [Roseobacter litoralis]MBC6963906.1 putative protoheme IX biogenesis protein [Roseobacter litoralis]MBC6964009.1 putative protoheme IX biogenesis protein [Roseobacter litoralis]